MSQCVPSWDVDENPTPPRVPLRNSNSSSTIPPGVTMLDYEVAELTWENGQPSMHGLGLPRVLAKPPNTAATAATTTSIPSKYTWEKPRASGTLESIVNQATRLPHHCKSTFDGVGRGGGYRNELVPWFDPHRDAAVLAATATSNTVTMDALVPCSNRTDEPGMQGMESAPGGLGTCIEGCSTHVASCGGPATLEGDDLLAGRHDRAARVPAARELSSRDQSVSVSGSATFGRDSQPTYDREFGVGFTSASTGSPENTSSAKQCTKTGAADDHDSVCHSTQKREAGNEEDRNKGAGKSSVSTKRSRAAAIHNQSERKRRDKINQRMKTLQKLVPNSSKTDKASMLDEVIEYLKQLQAQVQMMSRMKMSSMMLPMTMQQLQMSMMTPMGIGMGMGMGMGMDMNTMSCANIPGIPPLLHPSAFMLMASSWDASGGDRLQVAPATVMPDPFFPFFACQSQPMNMDAYSRMAAMYQQLHQPPASSSKS